MQRSRKSRNQDGQMGNLLVALVASTMIAMALLAYFFFRPAQATAMANSSPHRESSVSLEATAP